MADSDWRRLKFRDDDRQGFQFEILQAQDGDFHLSVVPLREDLSSDEDYELYIPCCSASIRVRTPMAGGGLHSKLWFALAKLFKDTPQ